MSQFQTFFSCCDVVSIFEMLKLKTRENLIDETACRKKRDKSWLKLREKWILPAHRHRWLHQQQPHHHLPHPTFLIESIWRLAKVLWNTIWSCFCRIFVVILFSFLLKYTDTHIHLQNATFHNFLRIIFPYFSLYYFISAFQLDKALSLFVYAQKVYYSGYIIYCDAAMYHERF